IHDRIKFGVNVYSCKPSDGISFLHVTNLYHPSTLDGCAAHDGAGTVPGIKDDNDDWDFRPHRHRVIQITFTELALFGKLFDGPETEPHQARLCTVHSREVASVLDKLSSIPRKLRDLADGWFASKHWNEVYAQQDGTIYKNTTYPASTQEWILSGPHFH